MRISVDEARKILQEKKLEVLIIFSWDEETHQLNSTTCGNNRRNADLAYEHSRKLAEVMGYDKDSPLVEDKRHEHTNYFMPDARGYSKRKPALTDTDRISFGKYKDELLQDVPASYLKWLYDEQKPELEKVSVAVDSDIVKYAHLVNVKLKLYNYIHNSIDAILMELGEKRR